MRVLNKNVAGTYFTLATWLPAWVLKRVLIQGKQP
nr:hypothetical protein Q903MT_gene5076 [Picea sitchensis]